MGNPPAVQEDSETGQARRFACRQYGKGKTMCWTYGPKGHGPNKVDATSADRFRCQHDPDGGVSALSFQQLAIGLVMARRVGSGC